MLDNNRVSAGNQEQQDDSQLELRETIMLAIETWINLVVLLLLYLARMTLTTFLLYIEVVKWVLFTQAVIKTITMVVLLLLYLARMTLTIFLLYIEVVIWVLFIQAVIRAITFVTSG